MLVIYKQDTKILLNKVVFFINLRLNSRMIYSNEKNVSSYEICLETFDCSKKLIKG